MSTLWLPLILVALGVPVAAPARVVPSDGPRDLVEKAYTAAEEHRYCEAVPLFLSLHERAPQPRHLYRAAEVAYAAGDLAWARDLYRSVKESYPKFDKIGRVNDRLRELTARLDKGDTGAACAQPATACGDWLVHPGEQCDDGNTQDGDGCDGNCALTSCGNGRRTGREACDDGNTIDGDGCNGNCTLSGCGNGTVDAAEQCDDGNAQDGDGCDHTCAPTGCGNGVVTAGEACDDGNSENGDGCDRDCTITLCGDGVRSAGEACDDGNFIDGDGCNRDCTLPPALPAAASSQGTRGGSWLPTVLLVSGAGVSALGLVGVGLGVLPLFEAQRARDALAAGAGGAEAEALSAQAADAEVRFSASGVPLVILGSVGAALGVTLLGLGVWRSFADDDEAAAPAP